MADLVLLIELLDDVVISASAASTGGHASHRYVPGAVLRGAVADRLYGCPGIDSFALFHKGTVRFGDGWPLAVHRGVGRIALPTPLCLHHEKADAHCMPTSGRLPRELLSNRAHDQRRDMEQPKQLRDGFITGDLQSYRPLSQLRMKTAIAPATGAAAEAQLFGYDALQAGSHFLSVVEVDEASLLDEVAKVLRDTTLRFGRSKSTEYGRARITVLDDPGLQWASEQPEDGLLRLWALSDVAFIDRSGRPTLRPKPEHIGLCSAKWRWVPSHSFIRTRRYLPFNRHWLSPELERVVINAGSVITLAPGNGTSPTMPQGLVWAGMGREAGLGRLWASPRLLAGELLQAWPGLEIDLPRAPSANRPDEPLLVWLEGRRDEAAGTRGARDRLEARLAHWRRLYDTAASLQGLEPTALVGPGPSQWRQIAHEARGTTGRDALRPKLIDDANGIARKSDEAWDTRCSIDTERATFHQQLRAELDEIFDGDTADETAAADLARLASELFEETKGRSR